MNNNKIIKLIFIIFYLIIFINLLFSEKYFLNKNWFYQIEKNISDSSWKRLNITQSLNKQNILLKKGDVIYYKYLINLDNIKYLLDKYKTIGIYFGKIEGEAEIFINNNKLFTSYYFDNIIFFEINKSILASNNNIILKVTKNNKTFYGCFDIIPYIDNYESINNYFLFIYAIQLIIGSCLFFIGLFYVFYFSKKLQNYEYLLYFFINMLTFMYSILKSPFKFFLINNLNISWLICKKLDFFALYLIPFFGLLFFIKIFKGNKKFIKKLTYIIGFLILTLLVVIIIYNFEVMRYSLIVYYILLIINFILYFYLTFKEFIIRKSFDLIYIFAGLIILFFLSILDIAGVWHFIKYWDKFPFLIVGIFFFSYSLGLYLSRQFLKLNLNLKDLTLNLEAKVLERTKQLEEANKQKTDAFINISHEIKTPLTIISNHLDKHIKKYKKTEELDIILQNVNKLKRDIINVLNFEKLDKDMPHYDHSQIADLSAIVERNVFQFKEISERKGLKLKFNISPNIYAKIDPSSFDSIISNIIGNALKFTESGGINVNLGADNDKIELIISDTGIGISKEMQSNIFKPYYQISHKKSNVQGIGMGLNIVKKIIDKVEGFISVDSVQGKRTTFKIILKRYFLQKNDRIQALSSTGNIIYSELTDIKLKEEKYDKGKKTILIVEDNLQMLYSLQNDLLSEYNIFYAFNGKEALEKIKNMSKPDIIISDIMMDVMDGYEFYTELLKDDSFKSVPFIFLTAKGSDDDKISGLQKGAVDYITKPFNIEELKAKLCSLLKVKEALSKERIEELTKKLIGFLESNNVSIKNRVVEDKNDDSGKDNALFMKYGISRRQMEIFSLLEKGFERKEISDCLKISLNTVKTHIERLFEKFNVNNKIDLINIIRKSK